MRERIGQVTAGPTHAPALQAACIADDMTGAIEIGALLACAGQSSEVLWDGSTPSADCSALVIDTETRHASRHEARDRCRRAAESVASAPSLYIKTDSTLRGHLALTFQAVLDAFPERPIVYAPAYPRLGRIVAGGVLYVDGVPVAETSFAADPRFPIAESSIPGLLAAQGLGRVTFGSAWQRGSVALCDSRTDEELAAIARAVVDSPDRPIAAGSGGLARHWAGLLPGRRDRAVRRLRPVRGLILVCGSLHPASRAQAAHARSLGVFTIATDPEPTGDPLRTARELAARTAGLMQQQGCDGLIVFGGDTAFALLRTLGCTRLLPVGEVAPGVPVSTAIVADGQITLVTKAGGFGSETIVEQILASMRTAA